ncbi:MAG: hypothetical protein EA359_14725 [Balneolaceae bacterium]|nr:MAG: hypothetical protein EA359_14725 [Balneolaceae bacterium]
MKTQIFILLLFTYLNPPIDPGIWITNVYGGEECTADELAQVSSWQISFTIVNTYEQETGPEGHRTITSHQLDASGTIHAVLAESPNPDNVMWEGNYRVPVKIDRSSFTTITNPQGVKIELEHITQGYDYSEALVWFFINRTDNTYSFNVHDLSVYATTHSVERYLMPDGTLFRENTSEKTERFNLSGSVYDSELTGQCLLNGNVEQGIRNNINFKRIEWAISPVQ